MAPAFYASLLQHQQLLMQAWAAQGVPAAESAALPAPNAAAGVPPGMPLVLPGAVPWAWPCFGGAALPPGPKQ